MENETLYTLETTEADTEYIQIIPSENDTLESVENDTLVSAETSVDYELINNQLADIRLCLIVIICLMGIAVGSLLGSILWGRIRK